MQKKERRMEKIEQEKRQLINFGHKFNKMGGTKVVIAYFGLLFHLFCIIYHALKILILLGLKNYVMTWKQSHVKYSSLLMCRAGNKDSVKRSF